MTAYDEFRELLIQDCVIELFLAPAADVLRDICQEYELRKQPLRKRVIHALLDMEMHYWGASIFCPALERAGLIRMPGDTPKRKRSVHSYEPTERGLEIYGKLQDSGLFEQCKR